MVEHCLAKAGVAGSNPVSRSIFLQSNLTNLVVFCDEMDVIRIF